MSKKFRRPFNILVLVLHVFVLIKPLESHHHSWAESLFAFLCQRDRVASSRLGLGWNSPRHLGATFLSIRSVERSIWPKSALRHRATPSGTLRTNRVSQEDGTALAHQVRFLGRRDCDRTQSVFPVQTGLHSCTNRVPRVDGTTLMHQARFPCRWDSARAPSVSPSQTGLFPCT